MTSYGELIDSGFDPYRENVYNLLVEYFENPTMTKIKDVDKYSMYMAKINAFLGIEYRYIIVFVFQNKEKNGHTETLQNLKWLSLQTRTMADEHNLPVHTYIPKRIMNLDQKISLIRKDDRQYFYKVDNLPISITLLAKSKSLDYNSSGTVITALETYQTIVNF